MAPCRSLVGLDAAEYSRFRVAERESERESRWPGKIFPPQLVAVVGTPYSRVRVAERESRLAWPYKGPPGARGARRRTA